MKKIVMVLIVALALLLGACSSGGGGNTQQSGFLGGGGSSDGGSGVALEFGDLSFQPQKGNPFSLYLNIKNSQRHAIDDLVVQPVGFDWGYVQSGLNREYTISMGPSTESGPSQNAQIYEGIVLDGFTGDYNWNPIFKYCYTATTNFREQVAVPNALGQIGESNSDRFSNGPLEVVIDSIYPIGEDRVGVDFSIKNTQNGVVVNECFQDENRNQFGNTFTLDATNLGSTAGTCEPTSAQEYMISQNSAKFKCEFQRSGTDPYSSQITVAITYKYQQQIQQQISVVDLDNR